VKGEHLQFQNSAEILTKTDLPTEEIAAEAMSQSLSVSAYKLYFKRIKLSQ